MEEAPTQARALRILIVSHEYPPISGGGSAAIAELTTYLARQGHAVALLTSHHPLRKPGDVPGGVRLLAVHCFRRRRLNASLFELLVFQVVSLAQVVRAARRFRADVCLANFGIPAGWTAYHLHRVSGVPYLCWLGGHDVPGFTDERFAHLVQSRFYRDLLHRVYQRAAVVMPNSSGLQSNLHALFPDLASRVVPYGIDTDRFSASAPPDRGGKDTCTILHVGRLVERKRQRDLLAAARLLAERHCPFRLSLVGDGPLRNDLAALVRKNKLDQHVHLQGFVEPADMPALYRRADLFVLPSTGEGMPHAVLEAMASGLPVIMTQIQGADELVEDGINGFQIPVGRPDILADRLERLLQDASQRTAMSRAAIAKASTFDWSAIGHQVETVLRDAAT